MSERCSCTTNPNEHDHRFLRPVTVAATICRPVQTVLTWAKRGAIPSNGEKYGDRKVCLCCAAEQSSKTAKRWVKRAHRRRTQTTRRLVA